MLDLLMAVFLFLIVVGGSVVLWHKYNNKLVENIIYEDLEIKGLQVSDLLIRNEGKPSGWEKNLSSVEVLGLADTDRQLSSDKVDALGNLSYNKAVKLLNLDGYEFYLEVGNFNYGLEPNGQYVVNVQRAVIYNGVPEVIEVAVWE